MILQLYYLPPLLPLQSVTLLAAHLVPAPVCQLWYCPTVLFKVLYYEVKNVLFFVYLCEKYYKPITVQCYIADQLGT